MPLPAASGQYEFSSQPTISDVPMINAKLPARKTPGDCFDNWTNPLLKYSQFIPS